MRQNLVCKKKITTCLLRTCVGMCPREGMREEEELNEIDYVDTRGRTVLRADL